MNINLKNTSSKLFAPLLMTVVMVLLPSSVFAIELSVSDNGSGSTSEVNLSFSSSTQIHQSNDAQVKNDAKVDSNTGGNNASGNTTGGTSITTGDTNTKIKVATAANSSVVNSGCCPQAATQVSLVISGNGSSSDNQIKANVTQSSNISVNQEAQVNNHISTLASTGNNEASSNTGNVAIKTGNISLETKLRNHSLNLSSVNGTSPTLDIIAKIVGNGSDSENNINVATQNSFKIFINKLAEINNVLETNVNSGGNSASGNVGNATIGTGNIHIGLELENGPINTSIVTLVCCQQKKEQAPSDGGQPGQPAQPGPPPGPAAPPGPAGPPGPPGPGGGGGPGQVLAAMTSAGQILPLTGSFWIVLLTLMSALMFVLGLYLRLHPGQDPGKNYVYV